MKNLLLIIVLAFISWNANAHNPLTAKVELNTSVAGGGLLHIYLAQAGLDQALIKYNDQTDFSTISEIDYKKLAVQYIKSHIDITANGIPLVIGEGGIKLGSHQTDFKFAMNQVPQNIQSLHAKIDLGKENGNHHTIFWWKQKEGSRKVVLSQRNKFQSTLSHKQAVVAEEQVNNISDYKSIGAFSIAILLLLATLFWSLYPITKTSKIFQ